MDSPPIRRLTDWPTPIRAVFENPRETFIVVSINQQIHRFDGTRFTAVRAHLSEDVGRTGQFWCGASRSRGRVVDTRRGRTVPVPKSARTWSTSDGFGPKRSTRPAMDWRVMTSTVCSRIRVVTSGSAERRPRRLALTRWERATEHLPSLLRRRTACPPSAGQPHLARIASGNVWIGFWNGGLARYRNGRFTLFTTADGAPAGAITSLYLDAGRPTLGLLRPGRRQPY